MKAEIICVGSEILYGDILNTNTKYLSGRLTDLGILVYYQTVVGDYEQDLLDVLEAAYNRSDVVILTGGLGPTHDDITKETIAKSMDKEMILDQKSYDRIVDYFNKRGYVMAKSNKKQAMYPVGGTCLTNNNGTAPGLYSIHKNTHVFVLPGPPREMTLMFEEQVLPYLVDLSDQVVYSKTLKMTGIGESEAASKIQGIIDGYENPIIAPYAKRGEVHFKITATSDSSEVSQSLVLKAENDIRMVLGQFIYSDTEKNLTETIIDLLAAKSYTISFAESCTGGWLAKTFVDESGASSVFNEGFITYSNEAKMKYLGVSKNDLISYGAVSEVVAKAMATGVRKASNAHVGVGVTGIAGPGGGTPEKPVGTIHVAIDIEGEITHLPLQLNGDRTDNRELTVKRTLTSLYYLLI